MAAKYISGTILIKVHGISHHVHIRGLLRDYVWGDSFQAAEKRVLFEELHKQVYCIKRYKLFFDSFWCFDWCWFSNIDDFMNKFHFSAFYFSFGNICRRFIWFLQLKFWYFISGFVFGVHFWAFCVMILEKKMYLISPMKKPWNFLPWNFCKCAVEWFHCGSVGQCEFQTLFVEVYFQTTQSDEEIENTSAQP